MSIDRTDASAEATDVTGSGGIEPWLREILRCPACRSELADGTSPQGAPELVCTAADCGLAYRVDDGIPVLLVDEARPRQD